MDDQAHGKLDRIAEDIIEIKISTASISTTLTAQKESLDYHIRRTDALEDRLELLKSEVDKSKGMKELTLFLLKAGSLIAAVITALKKFF